MAIEAVKDIERAPQSMGASEETSSREIPRLNAVRDVGLRTLSTTSLRRSPVSLRESLAADDASIVGLAESIASSGIIEPIVVRPLGPDDFEVVAGDRRLLAAKLLNLTHIPCVVREYSDFDAFLVALTENLQREDLSAIEKARGISRLTDQWQLTQAEVGKQIGMPQSVIAHYLRLLSLPEEIQSLIHNGHLSMGHGKLLAGVADGKLAIELAQDCVANNRSVRDLEASLATGSSGIDVRRSPRKARSELELPNGVFVVIKQSQAQPNTGTIEIPYWSEGEKEWVISALATGHTPTRAVAPVSVNRAVASRRGGEMRSSFRGANKSEEVGVVASP